jgi:hypothetical protein
VRVLRVLRKIFGIKRKEVPVACTRLQNKELINIIRVIKSRRIDEQGT